MTSTQDEDDVLRAEIIDTLSATQSEEGVRLDYLVANTSAESRRVLKRVLRQLLDEGKLRTRPGFRYDLSSHPAEER